jgi:hypothetical protein
MTKYRIKEIEYESGDKNYKIQYKGITFKEIMKDNEIFYLPPFILIPFFHWIYKNLFYSTKDRLYYSIESAKFDINSLMKRQIKNETYIKIN